jgi:hypothetical protein
VGALHRVPIILDSVLKEKSFFGNS